MTQTLRHHNWPTAASPQAQRVVWGNAAWRTLRGGRVDGDIPKGLDAFWNATIGRVENALPRTRTLMRRAAQIVESGPRHRGLGTAALRDELAALRNTFRLGREKREDVDAALALLREVARRELGMEPYPVQVAAALAGTRGLLIEMATGEGKSLAASLIAAIAGWRGRGCHVMTTNDYLASRDAEHFAGFYRAAGLSVAAITGDTEPPERREAYAAGVTYLTNKEAAADYLRDRLQMGPRSDLDAVLIDRVYGSSRGPSGPAGVVQRGLEQAIIDEADSILIDEAVTPLIISGESPLGDGQIEDYQRASFLTEQLVRDQHFRVDAKFRDVELTSAGKRRLAELARGMEGLWRSPRVRHERVGRALSAEHLFRRDEQYVVLEGKVVIVDESTGRLMPDRSWRDGLHQAVEIKEGLEVSPAKATLTGISFQRFFRRYHRVTGMTGTAMECRQELWQVYRLATVRIPTHRSCVRLQLPDRFLPTADAKWDAVVEEVRRVHGTDRPVLVGTRSVESSELLSRRLTQLSLEHVVLNAVNHEREAEIVARAGQKGTITVATNMAGRGTDIKLGPGVRELGGLHVVSTERNESARVDRQLFGRAGRQGDPGSATAFLCPDDELLARHAKRSWRGRFVLRVSPLRAAGVAQHVAGVAARRQRTQLLRQDEHERESLGFAGGT